MLIKNAPEDHETTLNTARIKSSFPSVDKT